MKLPPRWIFLTLTVGGLLAAGVFIGIMRVQGVSTGDMVRAVLYGLLGLLMLWGAVRRPPEG